MKGRVNRMAHISIDKILECTEGKLLTGNKETIVKGFSVNSRNINDGDMFIPTIGERTNGHKCERCWNYVDELHEGNICERCKSVIE